MPKPQHELPITDAGHKFLELYAEPVVTNTYLKVAILVLSVVTLASLALLYRAQTAALRLKPLILASLQVLCRCAPGPKSRSAA